MAGAFKAAFGQEPPLVRTFSVPDYYGGEKRSRPLRFEAQRLVRLSGNQYALVVSEQFADAHHVDAGDVAIAYLHLSHGSWRSDGLWTELARFRTFGVFQTSDPDDVGPVWVDTAHSQHLVAVRTVYCGMGDCLEQLAFFRLGREKPRFIGVVKGGDESDGTVSPSPKCSLHARLLPALSKKALFVLLLDGRAARTLADVRATQVSERIEYDVVGGRVLAVPGQRRLQCTTTTVEVNR